MMLRHNNYSNFKRVLLLIILLLSVSFGCLNSMKRPGNSLQSKRNNRNKPVSSNEKQTLFACNYISKTASPDPRIMFNFPIQPFNVTNLHGSLSMQKSNHWQTPATMNFLRNPWLNSSALKSHLKVIPKAWGRLSNGNAGLIIV